MLSPFVRTPDIDENGNFNGKFLSTKGDKVHCSIEDLEANTCMAVDSSIVDASDYRKHDPSGGYEGFSVLADGSIAAFIEKQSGDSTLGDEPGTLHGFPFSPMDIVQEYSFNSIFQNLSSSKVFASTKYYQEMEVQALLLSLIPSWDFIHSSLMLETLQMYLLSLDRVILSL